MRVVQKSLRFIAGCLAMMNSSETVTVSKIKRQSWKNTLWTNLSITYAISLTMGTAVQISTDRDGRSL
ncbi:hypothetical protein SDC9_153251 [bioreactor metagenome]|uniref:Uncharacterized protein n=1 Tax=bioreactor metagenome TaxID=1076179 RepID=A0A645EVW4_9ZZZZ